MPVSAEATGIPPEPQLSDTRLPQFCVHDASWMLSHAGDVPFSEELIYRGLTESIIPGEGFEFPRTGSRNLRFQVHWAKQYPWLLYCKTDDGVVCKYCCLFVRNSNVGKGDHQQTGSLVQKPFNKWKDAMETFKIHGNAQYHKRFEEQATIFLANYEKGTSVAKQLERGRKAQVIANRAKLKPIISCVIFCGRQGIALRGKKDAGPLQMDWKTNDGNLRSLLRFRIEAGDKIAEDHILNAPKNAVYLSPKVQNEIIAACGTIIVRQLVNGVNQASFFTIMADETTDIRGIEQMSLCVRYVDERELGDFRVREEFLDFVPVTDTRGCALAETITTHLNLLGINMAHLRGQAYDGAAAMSGRFRGCSTIIQESYPRAIYLHCASHSLNLAIGHACAVPLIRNAIGTVKEVTTFFRVSAKRGALFAAVVGEMEPSTRKTRLSKLCETRWVEKLDAVLEFKELFSVIHEALLRLQVSDNSEESSKAFIHAAAIEKPAFIVALCCLSTLFGMCHGISEALQTVNADLSDCVERASALRAEIQNLRDSAEESFASTVFQPALALASDISHEITIPRLSKRQVHRDSYPTESPEEYFRLSAYIPVLDDFLSQLDSRFLKHRAALDALACLLPHRVLLVAVNDLASKLIDTYGDDLPGTTDTLVGEIRMWRRRWLDTPAVHPRSNFVGLLSECPATMWPNIHLLLKLAATLPVTVASSERSFSTLRRLKTYLRCTTSEARLNGEAHLNIQREFPVSEDEVLDEMAKVGPRRLEIAL
jgi:hypothetical protein